MFYEAPNSAGESVLCYYSKPDDRSAVLCGMPECTHVSKISPDCGALKEDDTQERYGVNRIGDKLYYLAIKTPSDKSVGSIDLIVCDINGKNRKVAASIENTAVPFVTDVRYIDGNVLVSYYVIYDFVKSEETGELEMVSLEKYKFYMRQIDLSTGKIETLVAREEYDGYGSGTRCGEALFYNYSYHIEPTTGEMLTPDTAPERYGGFYVRDLSAGEEKEYKNVSAMRLDRFSPKAIMCYDRENEKLCLFDPEGGTFSNIADYDLGGYTADEKDALFVSNSDPDHWTRYNFETGDLTQIQRYNSEFDVSLNLVRVIGDTVWLVAGYEDNYPRWAYIDRNDFFEGKFENIKLIKEIELQ